MTCDFPRGSRPRKKADDWIPGLLGVETAAYVVSQSRMLDVCTVRAIMEPQER